jgi:hypothetical protein
VTRGIETRGRVQTTPWANGECGRTGSAGSEKRRQCLFKLGVKRPVRPPIRRTPHCEAGR